jgi:hypothetical protein
LSDPLTGRQRTASRDNIEKKTESRGTFFATTQATTNSPQSTIHPPQTHHQKNHTQNPETLEIRNLHHANI